MKRFNKTFTIEGKFAYISLTKGYVAKIDIDDLDRVNQYNWFVAIFSNTCYGQRNKSKDNHHIMLHRFIMNAPDGIEVDHRDHNGLNCTKGNLRIATTTENVRNRSNTRGKEFKGIWQYKKAKKKQWYADITVNNKTVHLGSYLTKEEAAKAYDKAAMQYFGKFAKLNFLE